MHKLLILLFSLSIFAKTPITVGSKGFTESILTGEMIAVLLEEKYDQPVSRKLNLGGTKIVFDALVSGDIDVYPDYTGTGYVMILKQSQKRNSEDTFNYIYDKFKKNFGLIWSRPLGVNNTYALAVKKDNPYFEDISTVSQLAKKSEKLIFAAPHEFMERQDGYKSLTKEYNLKFDPDKIVAMQAGLMYTAINSAKVDVIVVYSTDGRIKANDLKLLEDDRSFFPPYQLALLAKETSLKRHPSLLKVFKDLDNKVTSQEMTRLNNLVDQKNVNPRVVARNFLISKTILDGEIQSDEVRDLNFIEYAIKRKRFLLRLLKEHLYLSFGSLILAVLFSVPLGILLTRYASLERLVFPVINIFQTIPSLALLGFLVPIIGIGYFPALIALFIYSLLPIVRNTYTGIKSVNQNFVEASKGIGLTNMQILSRVELPLALPVIIAAIRTAAVTVIGMATIAAFVGSGGFGDPIFRGVATVNTNLILLGAIPSALLALVVDKSLGLLEKLVVSKGITLKK